MLVACCEMTQHMANEQTAAAMFGVLVGGLGVLGVLAMVCHKP